MPSSVDELASYGGWPAVITHLIEGVTSPLTRRRRRWGRSSSGGATPAQLIAFSVALRIKGETADELSGLLDAVLEAATIVPLGEELRSRAVDIVGTGGDRSHSINVSTMAAIVTAAAGVPVCKHGARGASSQCGTADVLEALGVAIELSPEGVLRCVEEAGIGFCFAPRFHPAFRFAAPARREVGVPLDVQPARADGEPRSSSPAGHRCGRRPLRRAHAGVVAGPWLDGRLDRPRRRTRRADDDRSFNRVSRSPTTGPSRRSRSIPSPSASPRRPTSSSSGADPPHNAAVVRRVLDGERGPHRDIVVLNAAAALVVAAAAESLGGGVELAARGDRQRQGRRHARRVDRGVSSSSANEGPRPSVECQSRPGIRRPRYRPRHLRRGRPRRRDERRSGPGPAGRRAPPGVDRLCCGRWCGRAVGAFADSDRSWSGIQRGDAGRRCGRGDRPADAVVGRSPSGVPTCSASLPRWRVTPTTSPRRCTAVLSRPTGRRP